MATTSNFLTASNVLQATASGIALATNTPFAKAYAGVLTGPIGLTLSTANLIERIQNGTATASDYANVLSDLTTTVASFGFLVGAVSPPVLGAALIGGLVSNLGHLAINYVAEHNIGFNADGGNYTPWNADGFWGSTLSGLNSPFNTAQDTQSPLILDLNGDGVVGTISKENGVYFDHQGDGFAERSGWVDKNDGLLVWDRNGDGQINTGAELFGNNMRLADGTLANNGFHALKMFDTNNDKKVDAQDANFNKLQVWKDANSNGVVNAGELMSLAQAGVGSISTQSALQIP